MPSNRAAFDFETGEEANPKGFRLLPGNAELVARVDLGSAGRSCALWLDGITSLQADARRAHRLGRLRLARRCV
jgi:hypothetical protein